MRRGRSAADGCEMLCRGAVAKGLVRSVVVVMVGEGVDVGLELVDAVRQVEAGIERVAPGALGAFDGAVELGPFGWQHVEGEALVGAGLLELGVELRSAVDLDAGDGERGFGAELVEQGRGGPGGCDRQPVGEGPGRARNARV